VRTICGFDAARNDWRLPTQALRMGFWLKTCASILHTEALAACDSEREKQAEDFLTLYRKEWSDEVAFRARRVIRERKLNKPQPLPLTEDLQQLQAYLKRRATACIDMLRNNPATSVPTRNSARWRSARLCCSTGAGNWCDKILEI
jgi:hypothetical protein